MTAGTTDTGRKILLAAIACSLAIHLFWLFAVRIVSAPAQALRFKASRVTFLGPILSAGRTEVTAGGRQLTYLEERQARRSAREEATPAAARGGPSAAREGNSAAEAAYAGLVGSAVEKAKAEPDYGAE